MALIGSLFSMLVVSNEITILLRLSYLYDKIIDIYSPSSSSINRIVGLRQGIRVSGLEFGVKYLIKGSISVVNVYDVQIIKASFLAQLYNRKTVEQLTEITEKTNSIYSVTCATSKVTIDYF